MKTLLSSVLFIGLACSALAVERSELDSRIRNLSFEFESMQLRPESRIPAKTLRQAKGIILLERTKAGFLFAYQGGNGVAMVKNPRSGAWSAPAFLSANEASLGLQVGGQQSFVVILLMNTNATRRLTESSINFGGEASGTAGNSTSGVESSFSSTEPLVLVYTDTAGLYGGVAVKGGALSPDTDADVAYYGQYLTMGQILFEHRVKPSEVAVQLAQKLDLYSK
jgi:lipid-binding SYLF domain-containing protein